MSQISQYLTGVAALTSLAGSVALWALRRIVRDELDRALTRALQPLRDEIALLMRRTSPRTHKVNGASAHIAA